MLLTPAPISQSSAFRSSGITSRSLVNPDYLQDPGAIEVSLFSFLPMQSSGSQFQLQVQINEVSLQLCICMCANLYTCTCLCMHASALHTSACTHAHLYTFICARICSCVVCVHAHMSLTLHVCVSISICDVHVCENPRACLILVHLCVYVSLVCLYLHACPCRQAPGASSLLFQLSFFCILLIFPLHGTP